MEITSKTTFFQQKIENQEYDLNYGVIKKGSNTEVIIDFKGANHTTHSKSCGCTMPEVTLDNDGFTLKIKYDSNKVGLINQYVKVIVDDAGEKRTVKINLKGQVVL